MRGVELAEISGTVLTSVLAGIGQMAFDDDTVDDMVTQFEKRSG